MCLCFVLVFRDLRGNKFECDCKAKWLYLWLKMTNSTVSDVLCIGPPEYQEKTLNDVPSFDYECTTTGIQNRSREGLWLRGIPLCFVSIIHRNQRKVGVNVFYPNYFRWHLSVLKEMNWCGQENISTVQEDFLLSALAWIVILYKIQISLKVCFFFL